MSIDEIIRRTRPGGIVEMPAGHFVCHTIVDKALILHGSPEGTHLHPSSGKPALEITSSRVLIRDLSIIGKAASDLLVSVRGAAYPEFRHVVFRNGTVNGHCALEECVLENVIRVTRPPSVFPRRARLAGAWTLAAAGTVSALIAGIHAIPDRAFVPEPAVAAPAPVLLEADYARLPQPAAWVGEVNLTGLPESTVVTIDGLQRTPGGARFDYSISTGMRARPRNPLHRDGLVSDGKVLLPELRYRATLEKHGDEYLLVARDEQGRLQWELTRRELAVQEAAQ
jgi:hypothetical protein